MKETIKELNDVIGRFVPLLHFSPSTYFVSASKHMHARTHLVSFHPVHPPISAGPRRYPGRSPGNRARPSPKKSHAPCLCPLPLLLSPAAAAAAEQEGVAAAATHPPSRHHQHQHHHARRPHSPRPRAPAAGDTAHTYAAPTSPPAAPAADTASAAAVVTAAAAGGSGPPTRPHIPLYHHGPSPHQHPPSAAAALAPPPPPAAAVASAASAAAGYAPLGATANPCFHSIKSVQCSCSYPLIHTYAHGEALGSSALSHERGKKDNQPNRLPLFPNNVPVLLEVVPPHAHQRRLLLLHPPPRLVLSWGVYINIQGSEKDCREDSRPQLSYTLDAVRHTYIQAHPPTHPNTARTSLRSVCTYTLPTHPTKAPIRPYL